MPTESSVVSSLIRDLNTRRLPSEPSDSFLFQPVPGRQAPQVARKPAPKVAPAAVAPVQSKLPVRSVAKLPAVARPTAPPEARGHWLQLAVVLVFIGGWAYYAAVELDVQTESTVAAATAAVPTPTVTVEPVAPAPPAAQPASPITVTPVAPEAPAAQLATPGPVAQPPAAEPLATPPPTQPTIAAETPAPKKHHRSRAKAKRVAKERAKATSEAAETASSAKSAKPAPPTEEPSVPAPPPKPVAPAKPQRQSMDSEDPLK